MLFVSNIALGLEKANWISSANKILIDQIIFSDMYDFFYKANDFNLTLSNIETGMHWQSPSQQCARLQAS